MGELTDTTKNTLLDWVTGKTTPAVVSTRYVALFNGDPQGAGSEVTTTIRVAGRVDLTTAMGVASTGIASNSALVDFGNAAGGATVSHFAIMDAAAAGNILASDALTGGSQTITTGNPVSFAIGDLSIELTG